MLSSSSMALSSPPTLHTSPPPHYSKSKSISKKGRWVLPQIPISLTSSPLPSFSLAASVSILLWSNPVHAGFLSGSTGLESVPGPQLPQFDFLNKWNENNQKRYAELDSKFKSSTVLKDLLEKSKVNKEKNKKEIQDKYCLRGAEWGVGDCSTQGMTQEEKDEFIAMLKKNAGVEE